MSLMSAFYVANSGFATSQYELNTVAHNLTNVGTEGYTRQQVLQTSSIYNRISTDMRAVANKQIGLGTVYAATRQVRDVFLDLSHRRESGRSAYYDISYETIGEIESLLGEMEGATFSDALKNLWESVQELYKDPSSSVTQNLFMQRSQQFLTTASDVYDGLCNYQDQLNAKVKQKAERVNDIAHQILSLNHKIVQVEASKREHANDLKDLRNSLLDELGELGKIEYSEDIFGNVTVKFEGNLLVNEMFVDEMGLMEDDVTGFYTPYWTREATYTRNADGEREVVSIEGAHVYDLSQTISTFADTDIGSLKAILFARGDHRANYTDIDGKYEKEISQSILMNMQAEYDQLIHNVVTAVNKVFADAANRGTGYLCDENGNPMEIFQRTSIYSYDKDGNYITENPKDPYSLFTCNNLSVNQTLLQMPTKLSFVLEDGSVDFHTAEALLDAFKYDGYRLNISVQSTGNFTTYYSNLISQVANSGGVFKGVLENQEKTLESIDHSREEVLGVSSDEELSNMIRYQNAYNANSRYFNVIDQMLETLLNSLYG